MLNLEMKKNETNSKNDFSEDLNSKKLILAGLLKLLLLNFFIQFLLNGYK